MTDIELADEFTAATAGAERRDFNHLVAQGVPRDWLWGGSMRFGIAEIITGTNTYQPFRDGKRAYIVPAIPLRDGFFDDDIGDLVAWLPANPGRWWRRAGLVDFINFEAVERAAFFRKPLLLHESPLAWLQARGAGAVILNPSTHLSLWLGDIKSLMFGNAAHARQIRAKMTAEERRLPEFHVLTDIAEAAE